MKQWLKEFVHNCVVHPMMPFLPTGLASALHDKNATWAFGLNRFDELTMEEKVWWERYFALTHYEEKKPAPKVRELAQALVDDTMDGGPLQQWLVNRLNFSVSGQELEGLELSREA